MRVLFPALAAVDLSSTTLPSLVALREAHAALLAQRDEVDADFQTIDAAADAIPVPKPGRRVPAALAWHPKGLPPPAGLPSLEQMGDAECRVNARAQRSFTAVVQLREWLLLMGEAAGLEGRGTALRECSRLIGVTQPLAGAWLNAIPGSAQWQIRSELFVICVQRRLGLPIHQASACDAAAAESLGDELLKNIQHTSRHNKVVAAWVRAVRAARGAAHTRATSEAPDWSAPSVPDFVSEFAGHAGSNQAGEVKVYNSIVSDAAQLLRGATMAFGATRAHLLAENLGDFADPAVVPPRHDGAPRTAKYQEALDGGHDVLVLVSEVWGGFSPEAMRFLGELAQARGDRVDFERESATWSTTSFMSYHGQMLSLAVQLGVATEIQNSIKHRSKKD